MPETMQHTQKGHTVGSFADMINIRHCHSSLSLQMNGRAMTRLRMTSATCRGKAKPSEENIYVLALY